MLKNSLIFCLIFISFGQIYCVLNPRVICYYENWFVWKTNDGKMTVDDVDSSLCTDIVYGYMGITPNSEVSIPDNYLMIEKKDLDNFSRNKGHARALVAIGGYSLSSNFHQMVSTSTDRSTFADSVLSFIRKHDFDGVTLDWSIPWNQIDFENFVKLLQLLHQQFDGKYTLGITVPAVVPTDFKVKELNSLVDFISVQTYDFHGSWEMEVGFSSPLDWQVSTLKEWYNSGATMNKLLMTIPMFGHTWILADPHKNDVGSKATGPGRQGPWSEAPGKLGFNEICNQMKQVGGKGWDIHKKDGSIYAVHDETWISFEDTTTCEDKSRNVTTEGYGGVVVQALANEDFRGLCGQKYPLLRAINKGLNKDAVTEHTHPTVATTEPPTPDPSKVCHKVGTVRDPKDCNVYHKCTELLPGILVDEPVHCPKNEAYDEKSEKCVDKQLVDGCH